MLHELRIYHAMPGKMPALIDRFGKDTLPIWKIHDIRPVGFWTVDLGGNTSDLYYMLEWDDLTHRERATASFLQDKKWIAVRKRTEKDGPLISGMTRTLLRPTAFSSLK